MKRTIIIMAKVPRAGNVKTRLQYFLSSTRCKTLAEAFLFDAINKARNLCDELIIAFSPAAEKDYFNVFADKNLILLEQIGTNLGEKMSNAFEFVFDMDSDARVLMIGTDSPTFPIEFIERAFETFESNSEIVLGKSDDDGFYLIGLKKSAPQIFENVEWSSPLVYEQITQNIEKLKINLKVIPDWYDVDNPNDLRRLRDEVLNDGQAQKLAPETFQWLISNAEIFDKNPNGFSDSESKF